ncbi:YibE/F family protein [Desulfonauticus submarinus]|nr:YibE/F family protein [Desulfonauticus submarinus]
MQKNEIIISIIFILISIILFFIPNKYEKRIDNTSIRCKGVILSIDNTDIHQQGLIKVGTQEVKLKILSGKFKGKIFSATNQLMGYLDRDKIFEVGDEVLVVLSLNSKGEVVFVHPQDIYRLDLEWKLFLSFLFIIIFFGGWTGTRALISFIFTALVLWKILIPLALDGINPLLIALVVVCILTTSIIFLVAGLNKKAIVALIGSLLGIIITCLLAIYTTYQAKIHGAVMPFSEPLLYAGFGYLNLTAIYIGSIFLAASGAVMDIAMDISASMSEVLLRRPDISRIQLAWSGVRVGRAVLGTMVTTLLLAYCGGYISLLMFFMAQGIPVGNMFNLVYVAAEVIKTLSGSFGLVLTAPFTAFIGAWILKP